MSQIGTFFQVFPVLLQIPCLSSALSLHSILEIIKQILSSRSFEELDVSLELMSRGSIQIRTFRSERRGLPRIIKSQTGDLLSKPI